MIAIGNFFFRWRDTAFSLVVLGGFALVVLVPSAGLGDLQTEWIASGIGLLIALAGQLARAITIGYAYIKRGGLDKKIYAETLVQRGMFAHCRNPLYLGNILILTGAVFAFNITWYYAIVLPLFYFIYICITLAEENFLGSKFGDEYQEYLKNVNRFIPGQLGKWSQSIEGMDFTFKRLIKKEHGTIFMVFVSLALVTVLKLHYRHGMAWDATPMLVLFGLMIALTIFQITASLMKRSGKLEWDPQRP